MNMQLELAERTHDEKIHFANRRMPLSCQYAFTYPHATFG